jgi:hypothetical protein
MYIILVPSILLIILAGLSAYSWYKFYQKLWHANNPMQLLLIEIPRENEKKELSAEQMFASIHGILRSKKDLLLSKSFQEHISFEIVSVGNQIQFYIYTPGHLKNFIEGQVYAQYPDAQIKELEQDYVNQSLRPNDYIELRELDLTDNDVLPIKTFPSFEVDPLAGITATLSKLENPKENLWIQIVAKPIDDSWHKKSFKFIKRINSGSSSSNTGNLTKYLSAASTVPDSAEANKADVNERDKSRISAIQEKSEKLAFRVKIRILYSNPINSPANRIKLQALVGTFKQFNTTNLNGFKLSKTAKPNLTDYSLRKFLGGGYILNIEELASLYHLPHSSVETPSIVWARSRTGEPPSNLPMVENFSNDITPMGVTNFRGDHKLFGMTRKDRGRHLYIIGQTGVGKSGLLTMLALADIRAGMGFALIDPHGDLAVDVLNFIPPERANDVIYFNPSDTEFPMGFNPFEYQDASQKGNVASEIIASVKKLFEDSWGPRLEYILRYTLLSLLENPGTTMLDITRLLTDKFFRKSILKNVTDPVVLNFWSKEFDKWTDKFMQEAISPVLNKIGAFTANPIIRNIVGQKQSGFNIRDIMDSGKILIINLSKGLMGEDNAAIMGSLLVSKVQLAAMSRADIANVDDRRPFYFYVDEFQNFATDSFGVILSEARKYALNLTVANQYIAQMEDGVKDAVFGNVGSIISFRVSADDAEYLAKYFQPKFEPVDLLQLHNRDFLANLTILNEKTYPFSARTADIPPKPESQLNYIIEINRQKYCRTRVDIERIIFDETTGLISSVNTQTMQGAVRASSQELTLVTQHNVARALVRFNTELPMIVNPLKPPASVANQPTSLNKGNFVANSNESIKKKRRRKRGKKNKSETTAST